MKRLKHNGSIKLITGLLLIFFISTSYTTKANIRANISFEVFYENLAPYGNWINDAEFGFVWAPQVDANFRPYYSNGYWTHTNYGNMWVSNYDWGWAPFHYGRWTHHNRFGWVWVPGYEWGPAWVSWREGGGYYGWAPMGPGVSINVSFGPSYQIPSNYWTFVPYRNLYASNVYRYHVGNRTPALVRNTTIINNTYVDNSVTYISGPSSTDVRRRTGATVRTYEVQNTNVRSATQSRVKGNTIAVYRPDSDRRSVNSTTRSSTNRNAAATPGRRTINSAARNPATNNNAVRTNTTRSTSAQTTRKQPATSPAQQTGTKKPAATRSTRRQSTPKTPATRSTTRKQTPRPAVNKRPQAAPKRATTPSRATRSTRSSSVRSATPVKQNNQRSSGATRRR